MTHQVPPTPEHDPLLIHRFVRLFGHAPAPGELDAYQRARNRLILRLPSRIRRGTARFIVRL